MKRLLIFAALLSAVACTENNDNPKTATIDFEGAEWSAISATTAGVSYSSDLAANGYEWHDSATSLSSVAVVDNSYGSAYILGGVLLSSYNSADITTYGDYSKDLYAYNANSSSATKGGGRNGSDGFAIVVGNYNDSSISDHLPEMHFADGKARKVLGCYVNSTTYFLNIVKNGNPFSPALSEGEEIKISATGYDAANSKTATVEMTLARKGEYITQWRAWDLSQLGEVVSIKFDITGGPTTEWGMTTPKYFAIDDITIEL